MILTPEEMLRDFAEAGVPVDDLWDLVDGDVNYEVLIPALIDWLQHLDERVPFASRSNLTEGLVRALTVPAARPAAAPVLIRLFREVDDPSGLGLRWVVGNALEVVADDSVFEEIAALVRERRFGKARQMAVLGLARSTDARAVPLLIELLDDDDVAAHAAIALGKRRAREARPALERHVASESPLIRREVKKALAKLG